MAPAPKPKRHTGPWADSFKAAYRAALSEVNLDLAEFISLEYGDDSITLVPCDESGKWEVDVEITWSESRQQYRAKLRQVPARDRP